MTSGVGEAVEVFATEMEGDTPPPYMHITGGAASKS